MCIIDIIFVFMYDYIIMRAMRQLRFYGRIDSGTSLPPPLLLTVC